MQTPPASIKELLDLIQAGIESWIKAGQLLSAMRSQNPNCYRDVMAADPRLTVDTLVTLEGIGSKRIYPYLLLSNSHGAKRLLEAPYEQQVKYWTGPVEVFVGRDKDRKPLIASKMVTELSPREIAQVFSKDGVRDIEQQRFHFLEPNKSDEDEDDGAEQLEVVKCGNYRVTLRDGQVKVQQTGAALAAQTILLKKGDSGGLSAEVVLTTLREVVK